MKCDIIYFAQEVKDSCGVFLGFFFFFFRFLNDSDTTGAACAKLTTVYTEHHLRYTHSHS